MLAGKHGELNLDPSIHKKEKRKGRREKKERKKGRK